MFVSVTRLHVRKWLFWAGFFVHSHRSMRQAQSGAGFVCGSLASELPFGFWTITVWTDENAMRQFRNSAAHLKAMPKLLDWCDEASYTHWQQDDFLVPSATVAYERLRDNGRISKVRHPSSAHASGKTAPYGEPKAALVLRPLS